MAIFRAAELRGEPLTCPYPAPFDQGIGPMLGKSVSDPGGLTQFGAHFDTLMPGALSSQRHWHETEDEFLMIVSGEAILIDDDGETPMKPGDCAAFPAGDPNGHHLRNDGDAPCVFIIVGTRQASRKCIYPDIDMIMIGEPGQRARFTHRDGSEIGGS